MVMIGYDLDRGGPKDSENAPNSFLSKRHQESDVRGSRYISVAKRQNPFPLILVKNELGAVSESLGPPLSRPYPIMTIAGL